MDRLVWAATSTFRVGTKDVAVRTSTREVDALLRELLAEYHVEGTRSDDRPSPSYWVRIIDPGDGNTDGLRPLHQLYRHRCIELRARTRLRTIQAFLTHLGHLAARQCDGVLAVDALALLRRGRAVLVPSTVRRQLQRIERRLWRAGIIAVDAPAALLDLDDAALVVPAPLEPLDETHVAKLGVTAGRERPEPATEPGSYPVAGWAFHGGQPPRSRAEATVRATGLLEDGDTAPALPALAALLRDAQIASMQKVRDLPQVAADLLASSCKSAAPPDDAVTIPAASVHSEHS